MSEADRRRLAIILARLSSGHDGEALNAARLAVKQLAKHGMRPEDMAHPQTAKGAGTASSAELASLRFQIVLLQAQLRDAQQRAAEPAEDGQEPERPIRHASVFAAHLKAFATRLTAWEEGFLADMAERNTKRCSPKQAAILWRIHDAKVPEEHRRAA